MHTVNLNAPATAPPTEAQKWCTVELTAVHHARFYGALQHCQWCTLYPPLAGCRDFHYFCGGYAVELYHDEPSKLWWDEPAAIAEMYLKEKQ